jgi:hypothetical protein
MTNSSDFYVLWGRKLDWWPAMKVLRCGEARDFQNAQVVQPLQVLAYEAALLAASNNSEKDNEKEQQVMESDGLCKDLLVVADFAHRKKHGRADEDLGCLCYECLGCLCNECVDQHLGYGDDDGDGGIVWNDHIEMMDNMQSVDSEGRSNDRDMENLQSRLMTAVLGEELAEKVPLRFCVHRMYAEGLDDEEKFTVFLFFASKNRFQHFGANGYDVDMCLVDLNGQGKLTELEQWCFFKVVKVLGLEGLLDGDAEPKHLMHWSYDTSF